jgi:hypothetical protein
LCAVRERTHAHVNRVKQFCDIIAGQRATNATRPPMKVSTLTCAAACVLLLAGGAAAHESGKPHKHRGKKVQAVQPAPPKDPYAKYWNDPGRAAPPFSYRGNGI